MKHMMSALMEQDMKQDKSLQFRRLPRANKPTAFEQNLHPKFYFHPLIQFDMLPLDLRGLLIPQVEGIRIELDNRFGLGIVDSIAMPCRPVALN